jgi:large subunit ribosomal protein L14e
MLEVGRVCLKIAGREAGRYCVVLKKMDENFVLVTGPRELTSVKRRRCNINHLEPLMESIDIKSEAPDSEVLKAYQKANLVTKLGMESGKKAKPEKVKPVKKEVKKEPEIKKKVRPKEKPSRKMKKQKAERKVVKKPAKKTSVKKKK